MTKEQVEAVNFTESSSLLSSQAESADPDELVWDELDKPWPSTFERTISLLASPLQSREQVEKCIGSPVPGQSPIALRIRAERDYARKVEGSESNRLRKTHSLDLAMTFDHQDVANRLQELKMDKARQYRAKILEKHDKPQHSSTLDSSKSTFAQCVFNFVNILMGVGLLGLPYVYKCAGWLGGSLCLLVFSIGARRTAILVARELNADPRPCHQITASVYAERLKSYPEIARAAFGESCCIMLSSVLYFELFSCICVMLVAMGDHLHTLYPSISFNVLTSVAATLSLIPTVLLKTPSLLSYLSLMGTCTTLVLVLAVVLNFAIEGEIAHRVAARGSESGPLYRTLNTGGILTALGMISYCFSGHAIVPVIYSHMEKPQQFESMVSVTFGIVVLSSFAAAFSGYFMFGAFVEEEVTLSLQQYSGAPSTMLCITWLMIFTCFSKIATLMFPLAIGLEELMAPKVASYSAIATISAPLRILLMAGALLVSLYCPSFSLLVTLVGMVCTMTTSIIFPAAAHLRMFGPKLSAFDKIIDWSLVICGSLLAVVGTALSLG